MTAVDRHRTLSVRGWLALVAATTFLVTVAVALLIAFTLDGGERSDDVATVAATLRDGADRWHDEEWRSATTAGLDRIGVDVVLLEDGVEVFRSGDRVGPDGAPVPAGSERDDGGGGEEDLVWFVEIPGSDPPLVARFTTPVEGGPLLAKVLLATALLGTAAAAVALAFGQPFVQPLRASWWAAGEVANGNLAVSLPRSRITEIQRLGVAFETMTARLARSLEQQASLERERRMFVAAIAHDLRTPLFALRGSLEGIETGLASTPERRSRYLAIANDKARMLDRLITDLFDYTRLEYLDRSPDRRSLDLVEVLHDLVEGLKPQAVADDVVLVFRPPGHRCVVDIDLHQFSRAVGNVLDNAFRHTPAGGRVEVSCGARGAVTWLTVADTGPGIDSADLRHVFEPLYRADRSPGTGGAGLGLAIARRILLAHNGTLEADNDIGGGAILTATLPTGRPAPEPGPGSVDEPERQVVDPHDLAEHQLR